jgi:hypothetical protein
MKALENKLKALKFKKERASRLYYKEVTIKAKYEKAGYYDAMDKYSMAINHLEEAIRLAGWADHLFEKARNA